MRGAAAPRYCRTDIEQWHEYATVLCATARDLIAFNIDSHPLAVIDRYTIVGTRSPGPGHLPAATTAIVYTTSTKEVPEPETVGDNIVPFLFDIAVRGIDEVRAGLFELGPSAGLGKWGANWRNWGRPSLGVVP